LTVRKGGKVVIGGDGQVSIGQTVIKSNAKKVRKLGKGDVIGGFAGATADAFTLFERLESKARAISGAIDPRRGRAGQGLAHRPLSAAAGGDDDRRRQGRVAGLTGTGDVLEPEAGVMAIGSGGNYALAAAPGAGSIPTRTRRGHRAPGAPISPPISASIPTAT
jgi:ATP-dependent HslUV protease subunit HslV